LWDWNVAKKRVMPPSTNSSVTTSAAFKPAWGRADGVFSTLIDRAGRAAAAVPVPTDWPVSGNTAGWGTTVVLVDPSDVVPAAAGTLAPWPQPASRTSTASPATTGRAGW